MRSSALRSASLAAMIVLPSLLVFLAAAPLEADALTIRNPIFINGDGGFTNASGVTWGSGTESDPYIIEEWSLLDYATHIGDLTIFNTTAHFIVRHVIIGWCPGAGIALVNCTNGCVEDNVINGCSGGVLIQDSTNISVALNRIGSNSKYGIRFSDSEACTAFQNDCWNTTAGSGIEARYSTDIDVLNNSCWENQYSGVYCDECDWTFVGGNILSGNNAGVMLVNNTYSTIVNNILQANDHSDEFGAYLMDSSLCNVTENTITDCWNIGIHLLGCDNCCVFHNNLFNNTYQASDTQGTGNQFDNGYPDGGNYWSDYSGVDQYNGTGQDVAGSDGIGDTPYELAFYIYYPAQDDYPLMSPFVSPSLPDTIPPTTSISISGYMDANGWYIPNATVTLYPHDAYGTVSATYYTFNGFYWYEYSGPFLIEREGVVTLEYYSVDNGYNQETHNFIPIQIDAGPPIIQTSWDDGEWLTVDQYGRVALTWTGIDNGSGIQYYEYGIDGQNLTLTNVGLAYCYYPAEGYHWIMITAVDNTDNATSITVAFNVTNPWPNTVSLNASLTMYEVASGSNFTVVGELRSGQGEPISGALISIVVKNEYGNQVMEAVHCYTDFAGQFEKDIQLPGGLPYGTYTVEVAAPAYSVEWTGSLDVINSGQILQTEVIVLLMILAMTAIIVTVVMVVSARRKMPPQFN